MPEGPEKFVGSVASSPEGTQYSASQVIEQVVPVLEIAAEVYEVFRLALQRSLQYFTSSQTRSHRLRQMNGRPHARQILVGRFCLLTPRMMS